MTSPAAASLFGVALLNGNAVLQIGLRLVGFVWLARLLGPEDFGLAAIAINVVLIATALNDGGMGSVLVRRGRPARTMTLTVFWTQALVGAGLAAIVVAAAPWLASAFDRPDAIGLIRVAACALLVNGVAAVPWVLLQRDGRFGTLALADLSASLAGLIAAMALAASGAGAGAALALFVVPCVVRGLVLLATAGLRPRWRLSVRALRSVLPYSLNLMGEQVVEMLTRQLDRSVIGLRLGAAPLGTYHQAAQVATMPLQVLAWGANAALFPLFARLQHEPARLAETYLFVTRAFVAAAFPVFAGLVFVADPMLATVLGPEAILRWDKVAPTLSILCMGGLVSSVGTFNAILLQALGKSGTMFRFALLGLTLMAMGLWIGVGWGLLGAAAGLATAGVLATAALTAAVLRALSVAPSVWARSLSGPALATIAMSTGLAVLSRGTGADPLRDLVLLIPSGVVLYGLALLVFDRELCRRAWALRRGLGAGA